MKWTPSNFEDSLTPMTMINHILGLRLIPYRRGRQRLFISFIYILVLISMLYLSLRIERAIVERVDLYLLEFMLYQVQIDVNLSIILYEIFAGCYYTKSFKEFVTRMTRIDETLKSLGALIDHRKTIHDCYKMILKTVVLLLLLLPWYWRFLSSQPDPLQAIPFVFMVAAFSFWYLYGEIVALDFCLNVRSVGFRYKALNEHLEPLVSATVNNGNHNKNGASHMVEKLNAWLVLSAQPPPDNGEIRKAIQALKQVHLELGRLSMMLCNIFRLQMTLQMVFSTLYLAEVAYSLYVRFFVSNEYNAPFNGAIEISIWFIIYTIRIVQINRCCEETAREADRTTRAIHALHGLNIDMEIRNEIYQFALQITLRPLQFSMIGFSLSYAFIRSCFGTVTMYGLIMIQMSTEMTSARY